MYKEGITVEFLHLKYFNMSLLTPVGSIASFVLTPPARQLSSTSWVFCSIQSSPNPYHQLLRAQPTPWETLWINMKLQGPSWSILNMPIPDTTDTQPQMWAKAYILQCLWEKKKKTGNNPNVHHQGPFK